MKRRIEDAELSCGEFLRHANFCEALAVDLVEPVDRAGLTEMAARWRDLANAARVKAKTATN